MTVARQPERRHPPGHSGSAGGCHSVPGEAHACVCDSGTANHHKRAAACRAGWRQCAYVSSAMHQHAMPCHGAAMRGQCNKQRSRLKRSVAERNSQHHSSHVYLGMSGGQPVCSHQRLRLDCTAALCTRPVGRHLAASNECCCHPFPRW